MFSSTGLQCNKAHFGTFFFQFTSNNAQDVVFIFVHNAVKHKQHFHFLKCGANYARTENITGMLKCFPSFTIALCASNCRNVHL